MRIKRNRKRTQSCGTGNDGKRSGGRPYRPPALVRYGTLRDLTHEVSGGPLNDGTFGVSGPPT